MHCSHGVLGRSSSFAAERVWQRLTHSCISFEADASNIRYNACDSLISWAPHRQRRTIRDRLVKVPYGALASRHSLSRRRAAMRFRRFYRWCVLALLGHVSQQPMKSCNPQCLNYRSISTINATVNETLLAYIRGQLFWPSNVKAFIHISTVIENTNNYFEQVIVHEYTSTSSFRRPVKLSSAKLSLSWSNRFVRSAEANNNVLYDALSWWLYNAGRVARTALLT